MKTFRLLALLLFCSVSAHAQFVLEKKYHSLRPEDRLVKQQVEYKDPGRSGEAVFWDFSELKMIDDSYELFYSSAKDDNDSIIIGREHRTLYKYHTLGDSLFCLGYENTTTMMNYIDSELVLAFPFNYDSCLSDYFYGVGEYSRRLQVIIQGVSNTHADAFGTLLLPGGETLTNVLRVHHSKKIIERLEPRWREELQDSILIITTDSIDYHLLADSVHIQLDTYRWFADGYRYPVFEAIKGSILKNRKPFNHFATAFYYTPSDQYYDLENDPENQERREKLKTEEEQRKKNTEKQQSKKQQTGDEGALDNQIINYNITTAQGRIDVEYYLSEQAEVAIMLFDMQGRLLVQKPRGMEGYGAHRFEIPTLEYPQGEYVLRILVGERVVGEKVVI